MTRLKMRIINWCLKSLAKSITDVDVLDLTRLSPSDRQVLSKNAQDIQEMTLWKRLMDEMENSARDTMFNKSKNEFDMIFGKACLYVVDIMRIKVKKLAAMRFNEVKKRKK